MARRAFIENDVALVWKDLRGCRNSGNLVAALYRGDEVAVLEQKAGFTRVRLGLGRDGWIGKKLKTRAAGLLECAFIDVGQGDSCLITTPKRKKILVDGGENQLAARYLAARFHDDTIAGCPVVLDAIVASHGDADHVEGLSILVLDAVGETEERKRIRIAARRVFHNGIVKRPTTLPERDRLGPTVRVGKKLLVPLLDDPSKVVDPDRSSLRWQRAVAELKARGPTRVVALHSAKRRPFEFLDDLEVDVLAPRPTRLLDGRYALPFLRSEGSPSPSASCTVNGHSVVLRIRLGRVSILLTGDLNAEAERELVRLHDGGAVVLKSEVFKVPHHGSDDACRDFIARVEPLISIISAGDEDARRDYLHPRASILGLLGRANRGGEPVVFVTNLAAFDSWAGRAFRAIQKGNDWIPDVPSGTFYARERTAYGIIHVRTDGERLLVIRRGARRDRYEAYSFAIETDGRARTLGVDRA